MNTDRRGFLAGLLALPVILRVGARPEVGAQEPRVGSPPPTPDYDAVFGQAMTDLRNLYDTTTTAMPNYMWVSMPAYRQATRTRLTRTRLTRTR